jgi:hypothetical protein
VCSGRLDISLSGILSINFLVRKNMIFCSAGNSPRGTKSPVQSELDVTDPVQNRLDVRGSVQSRMDVFVNQWG